MSRACRGLSLAYRGGTRAALERARGAAGCALVLVDGLAFGASPEEAERERSRLTARRARSPSARRSKPASMRDLRRLLGLGARGADRGARRRGHIAANGERCRDRSASGIVHRRRRAWHRADADRAGSAEAAHASALCRVARCRAKGTTSLFDALGRLTASRLAAHLRRQPRSRLILCGRPGRRAAISRTSRRVAIDRRTCRCRSRCGVRRSRPVRAADPLRRLRHGGRRSAGARPSGGQHADGAIAELVGADAGVLVPSE